MRFWDSSALVPLVVEQPASAQADRWLGEDREIAIWTLTPVELSSGVARLVREGRLREVVARVAEARALELAAACHVVTDVEGVKRGALRLLRVHALRAADALQLQAALDWSLGAPEGRVLHTFDARLALAAAREGFRVLPEPGP